MTNHQLGLLEEWNHNYSGKLFGYFRHGKYLKCVKCPFKTTSFYDMVDHDKSHSDRQREVDNL